MKRITWLLAATVLVAGPALAATPKDTVVMAKQIDDIISLDPAESFEFSGSEVTGNIYERLITYDLKDVSKLKGELAESWSAGADGKTYTFKMRKGIKFHSGNPVTAQDAAYSLQRAVIMNKTPGFILTQFGFTKENAKEKIRATDDQTLVIETGEAVAPTFFYYCLTAVIGGVVDMKTVQAHEKDGDFGNEWLKTNSAGSGPFKLVSWKAKESYTLERWDGYWGTKALPRRVVVRHVPEAATQRLLLEKGDIDYARDLSKDQLDAVRSNANIKLQQVPEGVDLLRQPEPEEPDPGEARGPRGAQVADGLRLDRGEPAPRAVRRPPGLPPEGLPGRGRGEAVQVRPREGQGAARQGRRARRLQRDDGRPQQLADQRHRPGDPGQLGQGRGQGRADPG